MGIDISYFEDEFYNELLLFNIYLSFKDNLHPSVVRAIRLILFKRKIISTTLDVKSQIFTITYIDKDKEKTYLFKNTLTDK